MKRIVLSIIGAVVALVVVFAAIIAVSQTARGWLWTQAAEYFIRDRMAGMPPYRTEAQPVRDVKVPMRDGVLLDTEIYLPKGKGPWPVIVERDPYWYAQYFSCPIFVRYGYACVHQNVRSRSGSGGAWYPFLNERNDGIDALRWILQQPWQNRKIGLWGESYLGIDQWAIADKLPPEVKTIMPGVSDGDLYHNVYHNGMFKEGVIGAWSYAMFQPWYKMLFATKDWKDKIAGHFPALGVDSKIFGASWPAYRDYLTHPEEADPYWQSPRYVAFRNAYKGVHVPVLMLGRTFDFFLPGMLDTFKALPTRSQSAFHLGPGEHGGAPSIDVHHPDAHYITIELAWFDHFLQGKPLPSDLRPGYTIYIHGADRWQHYDNWPGATKPLTLYLDALPDSHHCDGGVLSGKPPASVQSVSYRYDPRNPVPTRGGSILLGADVAPLAVQEQGNDLCSRSDVLSFAWAPIGKPLLISGGIHVKLMVASDAADTAFTVKLSEHFADGRIYNIRDDISTLSLRNGAMRRVVYHPRDKVEVDFNLIPIAWQLHAGSKLRLDISSSSFPEFNPHPNRAGLWSAIADPAVAQQTIAGGTVELPIGEITQ